MNIEKAIELVTAFNRVYQEEVDSSIGHVAHERLSRYQAAREMALDALKEKLARENPEPLTLEQLVKAAGDMPIWVHEIEKRWRDGWCIWDGSAAIVPNCRPCWHSYTDYGKTWIAYAHKPRTEDDHD